MQSGNQDRQEQEAGSRLVWQARFWIAPGTTRRQTQRDSRARGRRIPHIRMGDRNKWCSRRDLGGNVDTKYQSICSIPVCAAVCSTASTCRILFYSPSPLYSPSPRCCGEGSSWQRTPIRRLSMTPAHNLCASLMHAARTACGGGDAACVGHYRRYQNR